MATLQSIVEKGIPMAYRERYDYTNNWIPWCNKVLKVIVQSVKLIDNTAEHGVEIKANRWITPPVRCRKPLLLHASDDESCEYGFHLVNDKIKLVDNVVCEPSGTVIVEWDGVGYCVISPADVLEDYAGALLIVDGATHIIESGSPTVGGLSLLHDAESIPDAEYEYGKLIPLGQYLILKYTRDYKEVTASTDEVPLSDMYENAIVTGMRIEMQKEMEDLSQINLWSMLMQYDMGLLKLDSGVLKKLKYLTQDGEQENAVTKYNT